MLPMSLLVQGLCQWTREVPSLEDECLLRQASPSDGRLQPIARAVGYNAYQDTVLSLSQTMARDSSRKVSTQTFSPGAQLSMRKCDGNEANCFTLHTWATGECKSDDGFCAHARREIR